MSGGGFYRPDEVAEVLGVHVRTVRRYIREGRLAATRVGNRYRVSHGDIEAFLGRPLDGPAERAPTHPHADVSCVVDLRPIDRRAADRLTTLLMGAAQRGPGGEPRLRIDASYVPDRRQLRIVVVGSPADSATILGLVAMHQDQ